MSAPIAVSPVSYLTSLATAANSTIKFTPVVSVEVIPATTQNW